MCYVLTLLPSIYFIYLQTQQPLPTCKESNIDSVVPQNTSFLRYNYFEIFQAHILIGKFAMRFE